MGYMAVKPFLLCLFCGPKTAKLCLISLVTVFFLKMGGEQ